MQKRFSNGLIATLVATVIMGAIALPDSYKANWPDHFSINWLKKPKVTLGLDLQGGTQLDYRIDLKKVEELNSDDDEDNDKDVKEIINGVQETLERRINKLGVSEPQIYLSKVGDEDHVIVELAGIKDVEEAKKVVGKTIQLEFKELKESIDPNEVDKIKEKANETLNEIKANPTEFSVIAERVRTSDKKIDFRSNLESFEDSLPEHYKNIIPQLKDGEVYEKGVESTNQYTVGADGNLQSVSGFLIVQATGRGQKDRVLNKAMTFEEAAEALGTTLETLENLKADELPKPLKKDLSKFEAKKINSSSLIENDDDYRVYKLASQEEGGEQVQASHILIAYQGAERASETVTRTKEEAKKEADRLLIEARNDPSKFADLAKEFSDGPTKVKGGDLGFFGRGQMAAEFETAAFDAKVGDITDVTETSFGYHVIHVTDKKKLEDTYSFQYVSVEKTDENKEKLEEVIQKIKGYEVTESQPYYTYNELFYDLTPDPWKSTGLDGSNFKQASITRDQVQNPLVSILFDKEGGKRFEELTGRLKDKPIGIFVGGELVSAPNVSDKITGGSAVITGMGSLERAIRLKNDLATGAIAAPILLSGQYTISASLGETALNVSLWAGAIGLIILAIYMLLYYRLLGLLAVIALAIYSIIILFIIKTTGIVMTLAGIAGIILSIGMAVDANILIFERTREELNAGKNYSSALVSGFERAWSSIRDSNVSSLITCAILFSFGNSIIKGFATMLAIGIIISMFTAIVVTRQLMSIFIGTSISRNRFLLGAKK